MNRQQELRMLRRVGALGKVIQDRDREKFLTGYVCDLVNDGWSLAENVDTDRIVWVMRDWGTHLCYDRRYLLGVSSAFGSDEERVRYFKLTEDDSRPYPDDVQWEACDLAAALSYLPEERP